MDQNFNDFDSSYSINFILVILSTAFPTFQCLFILVWSKHKIQTKKSFWIKETCTSNLISFDLFSYSKQLTTLDFSFLSVFHSVAILNFFWCLLLVISWPLRNWNFACQNTSGFWNYNQQPTWKVCIKTYRPLGDHNENWILNYSSNN